MEGESHYGERLKERESVEGERDYRERESLERDRDSRERETIERESLSNIGP